MKTPRVLSRNQRWGGTNSRLQVPVLTVVAVMLVAMLWLASPWAFPSRAHVPVLIVENHTSYPANVAVRSEGSGGWTGLGRAPAGRIRAFHEVVDPGKRWEIRFDYAGRASAVILVDRASLADNGWHVTVPDDLAAQAAAAGLPEVLPATTEGDG